NLSVFDEQTSHQQPKRRPWDHAIDLKKDFQPNAKCKVYPLSQPEQEELRKFLDESLEKGYIKKSQSPHASPFFFIKKKNGKLRPVQDYRRLNDQTIRNAYPLPLVGTLLDKLKGSGIFTKLDVRWGYNNVRIKEGDEWKAAFKTPFGLYEPQVMFFGLCNSPATFQSMMDDIFADMIAEGWNLVYIDDLLIHHPEKNVEEHRAAVKRVLKRLAE